MSEHVVRVENLRKTYRGGLEALRGVSFDIRRGETFALVREERTEDPGAFVAALYARGGEPQRLEVVRPSLEDVYLSFLGADERRTAAAGGAS